MLEGKRPIFFFCFEERSSLANPAARVVGVSRGKRNGRN